MKLKIGYIIKSIKNNKYAVILPNWKNESKYNKIHINCKKSYLHDNRTELSNNFIALVKFNQNKKKYNLIKILN